MHVPAALWECWDPCYWWTYQRHCGMLGPEILVDVPCVNAGPKGFDTRGGTSAGQPTRELVGRETVFVSGNPAVFCNTAGTPEQVSKSSTWCRRGWYFVQRGSTWSSTYFPLLPLLFFLRRLCSSARSLPPIASGVCFTSAYLGRLPTVVKMSRVLHLHIVSENFCHEANVIEFLGQ